MPRRFIALSLILLLLFAGLARADEEAENLNLQGVWTFAGAKLVPRGDLTNDSNPESRRTLQPGKTFRIRFPETAAPASLGVEWYSKPVDAVIERYDADGELIGSDSVSGTYVSVTALESGTREIVIRPSDSALHIAEVNVFGAGTLPEPYHAFLPLPEKLDYMVIAAHPDDDVLFLGAAVPYLSGEEGLIGTIVYMTQPAMHRRNTEALNGAWTMGLRYEPIFGDMRDVYVKDMARLYKFVNRDATVLYLVRLIRQYRPVLLFTHEPEGEYGHLQHQLISAVTLEAVEKAQDPDFDSWSAEHYGTWQVQKLYWHDYEQAEAQLLFDPDKPLAAFDGKCAYEICCEAYKKHKSQQNRSYAVRRYGEHANSFNFFGLAYSAVGNEPELRAGIAPEMFSDYVPPTPSPTPQPTFTPGPTASPAPAPTPTASPAPTASPVPTPDPTPAAALSAEGSFPLDPPAAVAIAALLLLGGLGARLWLRKWRES